MITKKEDKVLKSRSFLALCQQFERRLFTQPSLYVCPADHTYTLLDKNEERQIQALHPAEHDAQKQHFAPWFSSI
ncbi:hypothetical protein ACEQPO_04560 [Bacillus sp. SL00103]